MSLEWKWCLPDVVGMWMYGGMDTKPTTKIVYCIDTIKHDSFTDGWWCRLGDVPNPTFTPPKKYKTPVLPDDYGKECEFSDWEDFKEVHTKAALYGYHKRGHHDNLPWIACGGSAFRFCRIEVKE